MPGALPVLGGGLAVALLACALLRPRRRERPTLRDLLVLSSLAVAGCSYLPARHGLVWPGEAATMPYGAATVTGIVESARKTNERTTLVLKVESWSADRDAPSAADKPDADRDAPSAADEPDADRDAQTAADADSGNLSTDGRSGEGGRLWVTARPGPDAVRRGDRVRVIGSVRAPSGSRNPGGFDFAGYLRWRDIRRTMRARRISFERRGAGPESVAAGVEAAISATLRRRSAGLLRALLLGRTDQIDAALLDSFRSSGTVHVLAVSGLHVGFVILIVASLARCAGLPVRGSILVAMAGALFFAAVVGPRPSVIRAVVMAGALSGSRILMRRSSPANALGLAATAILAWRPGALFDTGFALSFSAVAGILTAVRIGRREPRRLRTGLEVPFRRTLGRLGGALSVSVGAQLGTLPVLVGIGTPIAPLSPAANLLAVPLAAFAVATGALVCALQPLCPAAARIPAAAAAAGLRALMAVTDLACRLCGGGLRLPGVLAVPCGALILGASASLVTRARPLRAAACAVVVAAVASGAVLTTLGPGRSHTRIVFFDVGQGDATLIESRGGPTVLIDAGPAGEAWDAGSGVVAPYLRGRGESTIDLAVVTHGHSDHTGGLPSLLESGMVRTMVVATAACRGAETSELVERARQRGVEIREVAAGDTLIAVPACTLLVLWPPAVPPPEPLGENDRSIVIEARLDGIRLLACGDIERAAERGLRARGATGPWDLLKVAHHGSGTSTTEEFARSLKAALSVVSVGEANRFGHPDGSVLERLAGRSDRVTRTDLDGAVIVDVLRGRCRVRTVRSRCQWEFASPGPTTTSARSSGRMTSAATRRMSAAVREEMMLTYRAS